MCSESFAQEKRFIQHLESAHGVIDHFSLYLKVKHEGVHPTCSCDQSCQELLTWSGWKLGFTSKFVRGHNAKVESVFTDPERRKSMLEKRVEGFKSGRNRAWNVGLNKETSQKVKEAGEKASSTLLEGYASGRIKDWRDDKIKAQTASHKMSQTKKDANIQPWNLGLNKGTNESIASAAQKISESYSRREMGRRINVADFLNRISTTDFILVSDPNDYKTRRVERLLFRCKSCGTEQSKSLAMLEESPRCFVCHPKESTGQLELYDFVKSICPDAQLSSRDVIPPKELDVWIPSRRFAIEYNGLYWHSQERQVDPKYHWKKLLSCRSAGVKLLSIYEDEWKYKRYIVEGMIRHRLLGPTHTYDARKLLVKEMTPAEARSFFDANHLEGHVVGSKYFGLYDVASSEFVAGISIRRPFHKKYEGSLELGRCCPAVGYNVRGWLGKLTTVARDHARGAGANGLITYVDLRVGSGEGYRASGWDFIEEGSEPRFWWTDFVNRFNRFKIRASSKEGLSQAEVAQHAGMSQIYGMPNALFRITV